MSHPIPQQRHIRIGERAGMGSFGEVYRAQYEAGAGIRREYAVKLLLPDQDARALAKERLHDEARLLARIAHPSVPQVADLLEIDNRLALVIEWIPGSDLQRWTTDSQVMPARALCEVAEQVADALHVAWSTTGENGQPLQLVHRDVKPQNIRVTPQGAVKLLDFGIARAEGITRRARTRTGFLVGSLNYMAPESIRMEQVTHATDLFSLGCTLFEVLNHQPLFLTVSARKRRQLASRPDQHKAKLEELLKPLAQTQPEICEVVSAMVRHNPEDRPTASEVAQHFARLRDTLKGPSLRAFCRATSWESAPNESGPLTGKVWTLNADTKLQGKPLGGLAKPTPETETETETKTETTSERSVAPYIAGTLGLFLVAALALWSALPEQASPQTEAAPIVQPPTPSVPIQAPPVMEPSPRTPPAAPRTDPLPQPVSPTPQKPPGPPLTVAFDQIGDPVTLEFLQNGVRYNTSPLPQGAYTLRARFPGSDWQNLGPVDIVAEQTLAIRCRSAFKKCTIKPTFEE